MKPVSVKFAVSILTLLASGCIRIDKDPMPAFNEVRDTVDQLTGYNVYWDRSLDDLTEPISIQELLEQDLTHERAVQIALLNNRNLQATYENLGIAQAQLAQAGLLRNPVFAFSYRFSTRPDVTDLIESSLLQNFLEILLIPLKKKMTAAELEATKTMMLAQILDVIAETKIAFYTLQASMEIWKLKKKILLATELAYEAARRLFAAGNIKDLQLTTQRSLYEQMKLDVASQEIAVLNAREQLNVLMGLWGQQICWEVSSTLPAVPLEEDDFHHVENKAIACSMDLQVAYKELMITASGMGIDTSRLVFPAFNAGIDSEREDSIWYVGPAFNLAIPLFDFGQANSAKARSKIMQQWNQYTALAIDIRSKARSFRFSLLNAFRQSHYFNETIVPLAEQMTHSVLLQHNAMQIGIFHLLSAKREELEKKIDAVKMQQEYWIAKVMLQTLLQGHIPGKHTFETPLRRNYE